METFNVDNKLRLVYYQIKLNYDDANGWVNEHSLKIYKAATWLRKAYFKM